jgi:hypothetical protein
MAQIRLRGGTEEPGCDVCDVLFAGEMVDARDVAAFEGGILHPGGSFWIE